MAFNIDLESDAFSGDEKHAPTLRVRGLAGRAAVGDLYHFRMLLSPGRALTLAEVDGLLTKTCALRLHDSGSSSADTEIHGILTRLERIDSQGATTAYYLAELAPRAWLLKLVRCTRTFMNKALRDIVPLVLADVGLTADDFVMRVTGTERTLDYVVQYEESSWQFLSRWLEHEGWSYWFEQTADGEVLVIADSISPSESTDELPHMIHRVPTMVSKTDDHQHTIFHWNRSLRRVPRSMGLVDYDVGFRDPPATAAAATRWVLKNHAVPKTGPTDAQYDFGALGTVLELGSFSRSSALDGGEAEGAALAQVRAEELLSNRVRFHAKTQSRRLQPGSSFVLEAGPEDQPGSPNEADMAEDDDQTFFVTGLELHYGVPVNPMALAGNEPEAGYLIELEAVRSDSPFRPARKTPWPRIDGVLIGHVVGVAPSSDEAQTVPTLDGYGRYKVRLPFAVNGGGTTYAWVRMAEPMSGQSYGAHLPLHPGAEVLVAHVGGNPDRPLIVGTLPHGKMTSPITSADAAKARIRSAGDVLIEIDDSST